MKKSPTIRKTDRLDDSESEWLRTMWNAEFPERLQHPDALSLKRYLDGLTNTVHYIAYAKNGAAAGWLTTFDRDGGRWFAMILGRAHQRLGIGTELLARAKTETRGVLSGWVVDGNHMARADGTPYPSPVDFYERNGFRRLVDERLELPHLSAVRIVWSRDGE
ncbi:MAG: GNAT family N-acetyltransferase [Myxococcota bacterium]